VQAVAALDSELVLHPLEGKDRTLGEQLTLFQLLAVVLDPYTSESTWLLDTAGRILTHYSGADVRPAIILTCDESGAREYLGPWQDSLLVFCDPDRTLVKGLGISEVPALIQLALDCTVLGLAEGWDPETWRPIAENLAEQMSWTRPEIPRAGDPVPFAGTKV
jgi:hypothetical protein